MRTVNKPWGYEKRVWMDDLNDVWLMYFRSVGGASSLHRHPNKRKVLVVLRGSAVMTVGDVSEVFGQYGSQVVERDVPHRQVALVAGTEILEIESPPNKTDIVRLSDLYGREGKPYEDPSAGDR